MRGLSRGCVAAPLVKHDLPPPLPRAAMQVRQVWASSKENLCRKLGRSTGLNLWNYAHGVDARPVETPKVGGGEGDGSSAREDGARTAGHCQLGLLPNTPSERNM